MSQKNWRVKLWRNGAAHNSPMTIETRVLAPNFFDAKAIAENMHPGYRATDVNEIKERKERGDASSRAASSSSGDTTSDGDLGCRGVVSGLITLASLLVVLALVSRCAGPGAMPERTMPSASPSPEANAAHSLPQPTPSGEVIVEATTPEPNSTLNQGTEGAGSPSLEDRSRQMARVVDSRNSIVLQSGPRMSSKNVARVPTGSVVEVISYDGEWVQVQTEGGLLGYVRQRQLTPLE